jgi:hypothetical protein
MRTVRSIHGIAPPRIGGKRSAPSVIYDPTLWSARKKANDAILEQWRELNAKPRPHPKGAASSGTKNPHPGAN